MLDHNGVFVNTHKPMWLSPWDTIEWIDKRPIISGNRESENNTDFQKKWAGGLTLREYLEKCKRGRWDNEASKIIDLSETLFQDLPPAEDLRRKKVKSSSGPRGRATDLAQGNFGRGWDKIIREKILGHTGTLTLVTAIGVNCSIQDEEIFWRAAALLALGLYIEQQGRRSEIWGLDVRTRCFKTAPNDICAAVRLKAGDEPFQLNDLAATSNPGFLRRLMFAVNERLGDVYGTYGTPAGQELFRNVTKAYFAEHRIEASTVIHGPAERDGVKTKGTALGWILDRIDEVSNL